MAANKLQNFNFTTVDDWLYGYFDDWLDLANSGNIFILQLCILNKRIKLIFFLI